MIRVLRDRILIKKEEAKETTTGGIYIPDAAREKSNNAIIMKIGPDVEDVAPGDKILVPEYSGTEVKNDGKEYLLISPHDILCVVDGEPDEGILALEDAAKEARAEKPVPVSVDESEVEAVSKQPLIQVVSPEDLSSIVGLGGVSCIDQ